jgi:CSLREA domain-containing protein
VNTAADPVLEAPSCEGTERCTLREAIELANAEEGEDTIDFSIPAGSKIEVDVNELPTIREKVTIDGDSAAGATAGIPAIEIVPTGFENLEHVAGLSVQGTTQTRIEGLAIGGFGVGILIEPEEDENPFDTQICGNYVGTKLSGEVADPNEIGIEVAGNGGAERPEMTEIGGEGCAENVISGNSLQGVYDAGVETTIVGNRIGIGAEPDGPPLGNGTFDNSESAGVYESSGASEALIGASEASVDGSTAPSEGNLIDFNHGPGVFVEDTASEVSIRHDYFFENEGPAIEIPDGEQPAPAIVSPVAEVEGHLELEGTVTGTVPGEEVELEFYGSPKCDESGAGEGQTYLGNYRVQVEAGSNAWATELRAALPSDEVITATSTRAAGATTEFSNCAELPRTLTVNTTEDLTEGRCVGQCSLPEAIEAANETKAEDTIDFSVDGVIELNEGLPEIEEPVEIDGTSAPGYAGKPLVLIDGSDVPSGGEAGASEGLVVRSEGGGSVIKGLAIGGFQYGVWLDGTTGSRLCSSWIGIALDGTEALPNEEGVEAGQFAELPSEESIENEIGVGCGQEPENVIAGNTKWGVVDLGVSTKIGDNVIGVSPEGAPMPNGEVEEEGGEGGPIGGGGGIVIEPAASEPIVGGAGAANEIAYNVGPGITVVSGASRAEIRANSIYGNEGKGIEIKEEAPTAPTITAATGVSGTLNLTGAVTGADDELIEVDVFANAVCDPLTAGQGETFLGNALIEGNKGATESYAVSVPAPTSDDQSFITVTSTGEAARTTSEFSTCFKYVPPAPPAPPVVIPPAGGTTPPPITPTSKVFIPKNGEKVIVKPEEGKVLIKLPGKKKYVPLKELKEIPVGAVIDATNGRVTLTSIAPDGTEQTAEFFGGVFRVKQREGSGLVVLELLDTDVCPAPQTNSAQGGKGASPRATASSASFRPKSATAGKLWGSGHGNFRTEGHDGSATVEGTIWLVEDRCNGTTFFRTRRGIVKVRDFVKHKSLPLPAGKTYLAGEG